MATNRRDIAKLRNQLQKLSEQLDQALELGEDAGQNFLDEAAEHFESLKEQVSSYADKTRDEVQKATKKVNAYVEENPWHVIAAGAALGLLAGMILNRKDK